MNPLEIFDQYNEKLFGNNPQGELAILISDQRELIIAEQDQYERGALVYGYLCAVHERLFKENLIDMGPRSN